MVSDLLVLASGVALVAATAALGVQKWRRVDRRLFAGLISIAATSILFSVVRGQRPRSRHCLLPGFLSVRSLSSSLCDCIDSYRRRRRANIAGSRTV